MSQPPRWDPYGHQDVGQDQGRPLYQGHPAYRGAPYPGQPPYQGQPYGTPSSRQPNPAPDDRNRYSLEPPRRRKRPRVPPIITGTAVAVIGIVVAVAIVLAGIGSHTMATGQAAATPTSSASIAASPPNLAKIGSILVLAGHRGGEKMTITLVKVFSHPQPVNSADVPRRGDRLYAVQFRFHNTGRVTYSDYPSNGTVVLDSAGHSYNASRHYITGCRSFVGTERIPVGSSEVRCIVFEVSATARITQVWFALASGTGAQAGLWQVRS